MLCQTDFEPIGRRAQCEPGQTILEIARQAGVQLAAVCGGKGTCGQCRVQALAEAGQVSPLTTTEARFLTEEEVREGYRLACQAVALSPLKVHVPARSLTATQRTQVESLEVEVAIDPVVADHEVSLSPPTVHDIRSDADRLVDALKQGHVAAEVKLDVAVLRQLPAELRRTQWAGVGVLRGGELIHFAPPGQPRLGFAADLGTTKMAGYLVELSSGRVLASRGVMNPQISYGEDVMARIACAMEGAGPADTLRRVVADGFNQMIAEMCAQIGSTPEAVVEAVIVGNTAMHHLFLGLPVRQLGLAPYLAVVSEALDVKARDVGLSLAPGAYVHLLPNIAGFVGADHVAMLLATGIYADEGIVAGLDIGTNTEVALRANGRLLTCSTASGPAFEGAHIRDGMRATDGAIERVLLKNGEVAYQTIGEAPPIGLCGSGILDVVAELLKNNVIDRRGAMRAAVFDRPPRAGIGTQRVRETETGREFVVVAQEQSGNGRDIVVTRGDIGEIQLAKGAMRAGLTILLQKAGVPEAALDKVIIAGAFGSYISVDSAVTIGMFPHLSLDRFVQVGNAAGMGARMALVSQAQRRLAAQIAAQAEYIELTSTPEFTDVFAQAMYLA